MSAIQEFTHDARPEALVSRSSLPFPLPESSRFNSWTELERYLVEALGLETATICLLPDFLVSDGDTDFERKSLRHLDESALLIEISAGYRSRIVTHLARRNRGESQVADWPSSNDLFKIARRAKEIYARSVNDQVVELMAGPKVANVAWLYLDKNGQVESASANAEEFCRLCCGYRTAHTDLLPGSVTTYIETLLAKLPEAESRAPSPGLAFAVSFERGLVNCLLRRMAGDGYLLSLWKD